MPDRNRRLLPLVLGLALSSATPSGAGELPRSSAKPSKDASSGRSPSLNSNEKTAADQRPASRPGTPNQGALTRAEQERQALEFATAHHPQLAMLVRRLKTQNPAEYAKAVTELFRASEQIGRWQMRMPARYQIELDLWKVESRIRLLAARSATEDDPAVRDQLTKLLDERISLRIAQWKLERDRILERAEVIDETIRKADDDRAGTIAREADRLLRQARGRSPGNSGSGSRPQESPRSGDESAATSALERRSPDGITIGGLTTEKPVHTSVRRERAYGCCDPSVQYGMVETAAGDRGILVV